MDDLDWMRQPSLEVQSERKLARPVAHARRAAQRQTVNGLKKQALTALIPELPPPDTDLYVIGNGSGAKKKWLPGGSDPDAFDFGTFIPHVVERLGNAGCIAYISTWSMNRNHALTLIEMLNDGRLAQLTVFTDAYFQRREPAIAGMLITEMARLPDRARYFAFRNHVKAMCIANADETRFCTVTGSANLSAQPRCEQYVVTTAPEIFGFSRREFFEAMTDGK